MLIILIQLQNTYFEYFRISLLASPQGRRQPQKNWIEKKDRVWSQEGKFLEHALQTLETRGKRPSYHFDPFRNVS